MKKWPYWLAAVLIISLIYVLSDRIITVKISVTKEYWRFIQKYTFYLGFGDGFFSYIISPSPSLILQKLVHVVTYSSLGLAIYFATGKQKIKTLLYVTALAVFDELHQYYVPGRTARLGDIILDVFSAYTVISLVKYCCGKKALQSNDNFR
ncbi:VanZ family protein [Sporomusa malonica]|uniref:VanZ like family protein n=1 Tax=Sporomusa malonica TaxID=112901 RepID=A0A1W2AR07_9FIRM|nr:VanZ family protein [Sporomusa malonica]SMC62960.1 VanZ like family protein [Sporomusa malonica]